MMQTLSTHDKRRICREFKNNPTVNPITGRAIKVGGPMWEKLNEQCKDKVSLTELPDDILYKIVSTLGSANVARFKVASKEGAKLLKNVNVRVMRASENLESFAKSADVFKGMQGLYSFKSTGIKGRELFFEIFQKGQGRVRALSKRSGARIMVDLSSEYGDNLGRNVYNVPSGLSIPQIMALEDVRNTAKTFARAYLTKRSYEAERILIYPSIHKAWVAGIRSENGILNPERFMIAEILAEAKNIAREGKATERRVWQHNLTGI